MSHISKRLGLREKNISLVFLKGIHPLSINKYPTLTADKQQMLPFPIFCLCSAHFHLICFTLTKTDKAYSPQYHLFAEYIPEGGNMIV